jgi:hypothetical protein
MLENTHRFAIHIRVCKEATDEDRATALGQLSKTKKYGMKVNRKPDTDLDKFMRHPEVFKIINEHLASLVALSAQETLPAAGSSSTMIHHDQFSWPKHYGLDDHVKFAAPVRDAQTKTSCLPMQELKGAMSSVCPSSMVSAASKVSDDYFDSYYHYYAPPPSTVYSAAAATAAPTDVLARETACYRISDSHHNLDSPADNSTKAFYDNDTFQLLDPMTQYLRHDCYQTPAITSSRYHQQQQHHSSSWRVVPYSPSFIEPDAPPLDSQSCLF